MMDILELNTKAFSLGYRTQLFEEKCYVIKILLKDDIIHPVVVFSGSIEEANNDLDKIETFE
jgi:hypothetical protein